MDISPGEEVDSRVSIRRPVGDIDPLGSLADEVRASLTDSPRWIPSRFHYDAPGSEIFEEITRLPEYYPTRTELGILRRIADSIVEDAAPRALVEYGSGSASKTRVILDAMERAGRLEGYGAIEVSESALRGSAAALLERYQAVRIEGVVADFECDITLPFNGLPRLVLFLGSTIGNLTDDAAVEFLSSVAEKLTSNDRFLVGFDLVKDVDVLEAAYNDSAGVTEQFSLNLLRVLNRELGADFRLSDFRHEAVYYPEAHRIEAYVVARRPVHVLVEALNLEFGLPEGGRIRTEYSHKYTHESVSALLERAGLALDRWETDDREYFAVALTSRS